MGGDIGEIQLGSERELYINPDIMSGRRPPLYCTFTLIAMQGHQKNVRKKQRLCSTPSHRVVVIYITKSVYTKPLHGI